MKRRVRGEKWSTLEGRSTDRFAIKRPPNVFYTKQTDSLITDNSARNYRLSATPEGDRHRDTVRTPATLEPLTVQYNGAVFLS